MSTITKRPDFGALLLEESAIQDPYPLYARLRETGPVAWSDALQMWLVTGYREVREVYRSHERFSSVGATARNLLALPPSVRKLLPHLALAELTPALNSADQPEHTRQRAQIMRPLTPRRLAQKRVWLTELCSQLASELAAQESPELVEHFSTHLSYRSILGLFGAPTDLIPLYRETALARARMSSVAGGGLASAQRYERALVEFRDALEQVFEEIRKTEDNSIISALLHPPSGTEKLPDDEIFVILRTFFAGGHENLIHSVATTIMLLLEHPDQLELVRDDPDLAAAAYEEAIRFDTTHQANRRVALVDTELAGEQIRAGERILNLKASANRDPCAWTDPDRFDLTREQNEPEFGSVAFGQGIHFCAGAGIARLEGPIAVNTLLQRFPRLRTPDGWRPQWRSIPLVRMLTELPLVME